MKQNIRIGIVCIARKTFDYNTAEGIYMLKDMNLITEFVKKLGLNLPGVNRVF